MPINSIKSKEVESTLPEELRSIYRQMVEQYEYITLLRFGRNYVSYAVLAELVLAGWRQSGEIFPSSEFNK